MCKVDFLQIRPEAHSAKQRCDHLEQAIQRRMDEGYTLRAMSLTHSHCYLVFVGKKRECEPE
jgi:hypothetical protein